MSLQHGLRLLRREFVRERPARRAADHAEPLLQAEVVDLVDDAVDVVGQLGALGGDLAVDRPSTSSTPRHSRERGLTVKPQSRNCASASSWVAANGALASPQA